MIQKTVLDNGVRILSESLPQAYSVTLGMWTEVGSRDENISLGGVSHFIEHMAFKGTSRRGPLEIAKEIDRLGGLANAFTSKENTCFHARALAQRLPELCDLLLDLFLNPAYDPQELERERQVILQEISSVEDTPDELVHVLFGLNFWPEHPLGRPILGTTDSVSLLDRKTILDYLSGAYLPEATVVAAVGELEHQQLVDLVAESLSGLATVPANGHRQPPQPRAGLYLEKRDLEQVHVVLGSPATSATDPDRFAGALLNLLLGGNMSSRLFQEVRERRGLAYSVYSYLNAYSDSGLQGVYMGVQPSRAAEALKVVRGEMEGLAQETLGSQELSEAKDSLKASILLAAENPESRMTRLARNEYNFGRIVPLNEVMEYIDQVTLEDISRMAQRILDPADLGAMVLGPLNDREFKGDLAW